MSEKLNPAPTEEDQRRERIRPECDAKLYLLLAEKADYPYFDKSTGMFAVQLDTELITALRIAYPINPNLLTIENPSMNIPGFESGQLRIERRFGANQETELLFSPALRLTLESMTPLFRYDANPDNLDSSVYNFPRLYNDFGILPTGKLLVEGNYTYETQIHTDDPNEVRFLRSHKGADDIATYPTLHELVQVVMENVRKELEKLSIRSESLEKNIANEMPFMMNDMTELRKLPVWLSFYIIEVEKNRYNLGHNDLGKAHRAAERRERIKKVEYVIIALLVLALPYLDLAEKNNVAAADLVLILLVVSHLIATSGEPSASELSERIKKELKEIDRNI